MAQDQLHVGERKGRILGHPVSRGMTQRMQRRIRARHLTSPLEHAVRRVIGQRPERPAQGPPQRLPAAAGQLAVHLQLIQPQPHERIRRGRQLLQLPGSLTHHGDQLASRICAAAGRRQQLRRPRPGRDVERHQGPVPVRVQGSEDLVEVLIRDAARDPRRHRRPVHAAALEVKRLHRIAVRMGPPTPPGPVQRERVDQRAGARLQVEVIKAAQHRLAMRTHRRRIHLARHRRTDPRPAPLTPVRSRRLSGQLQPPAEIPGLRPARPIPGHPRRPQEPEPAQQVHAIRADGQLRPPRRLKVTEIRPGSTDVFPVRIDQPVRLPPVPGSDQPASQRHHQPSQIPAPLLLLDHDRRL